MASPLYTQWSNKKKKQNEDRKETIRKQKLEAIMTNVPLLNLVSDTPSCTSTPLKDGFYYLRVPNNVILPDLIDTTQSGDRLTTKWGSTHNKMSALNAILSRFAKKHPNRFIATAHTNRDRIDTNKSNHEKVTCWLRCSAHIHGCSTVCKVSFHTRDLFRKSECITLEIEFRKFNCHQAHKPRVLYGFNRDRIETSQRKPLNAQLASLDKNGFDAFGDTRNGVPSHSSARNAQKLNQRDVIKEIRRIQSECIQNHKYKTKSVHYKGEIHEFIQTDNFFYLGLWSERDIELYHNLCRPPNGPCLFIDATEKLITHHCRTKKIWSFKLVVENVAKKLALILMEIHTDSNEQVPFVNVIKSFNEHSKQLNGGKQFSPTVLLSDRWVSFMVTFCSMFNGCTLSYYLDVMLQWIKGIGEHVSFPTKLVWCHVHLKKDISRWFTYNKRKNLQTKKAKEQLLDLKPIALWTVNLIIATEIWERIINAIQAFNLITRTPTFRMKEGTDVTCNLWTNAVEKPLLSKIINFEYDSDFDTWHCSDIATECDVYITIKDKEARVMFQTGDHMSEEITSKFTKVGSDLVVDNPLYVPEAAEYMNENYDSMGLWSAKVVKDCIVTSSQTMEQVWSVEKTYPLGDTDFKRGDYLDRYIAARLKIKRSLQQRYFFELKEKDSRIQKQIFDMTMKVPLSEKEQRLHRLFKQYVGKMRYNREEVRKDYNSFYANRGSPAPTLTLERISKLMNGKPICKSKHILTYIEQWLESHVEATKKVDGSSKEEMDVDQ